MPRVSVLETAEWYANDRITSVRSIFTILAQLESDNPNDFMYSNFVNKISFKSTLKYFSNLQGMRYIYIGSHGADAGDDHLVMPAEGEVVSRTEILRRIDVDGIWGVFLSACNSHTMARHIAGRVKHDTWIAGYGNQVEWIKSTAFEMLFWQKIYQIGGPGVNRNDARNRLVGAIEDYKSLIDDLSFYLWFKTEDGVHNLVDY